MSSSSLAPSLDAPRRALSAKQAATVDGLTEAAVAELAEAGYGALTVRNVARRAGVAPATAYTYFASKEHLVAEVFWRRFQAEPEPRPDRRRSPATRAAEALSSFALVVAHETDLAAACTVAVLADDPDVWPFAIEELLRAYAPVTMARLVAQDVVERDARAGRLASGSRNYCRRDWPSRTSLTSPARTSIACTGGYSAPGSASGCR